MGILYVVATPIGNLEDISFRAVRILGEVDLIACEDTRRTRILLDRYTIATPTMSFHQHSKLTKIDLLIERLVQDQSIALVSDAGTPGINDPGGVLVAEAIKAGIQVVPIPGANAGVALLSASGIVADRYLFLGYLPKKKGRQTLLKQLETMTGELETPVVIYESPERLVRTLTDWLRFIGDMQVIIGRELTKQFEEIWRGTVTEALVHWGEKKAKGELVVIFNHR